MTLLVSVISLRYPEQQKEAVMFLEVQFEIRLNVAEILYFVLADSSDSVKYDRLLTFYKTGLSVFALHAQGQTEAVSESLILFRHLYAS